MLSFQKTAVHPFPPTRHVLLGHGFNIFTPHEIHLLPGHKVVVDFLLTVQLPPHHRGLLRLKPSGRKLLFHAAPLCE